LVESFIKGLLGLGGLCIDELAAYLMLLRELADRLLSRKSADGQFLPLAGI